MKNTFAILLFLLCLVNSHHAYSDAFPKVKVGIEQLMLPEYSPLLKGKRIGIITNQTAINSDFKTTIDILKSNALEKNYQLIALFAPEHGINGAAYAFQAIQESKDADNIPIYSLYGDTKRPTDQMLKNVTMLIFDIQDIGSRSYTYINTMFYAMEEAAKRGIPFLVLDRPNPINGLIVDGPMLEETWRSHIGYINIPYCHGMTVGELAKYFNAEYKINCKLEVIPMKGWKRSMTFSDTGLPWIPTSPYIPESDTPLYYPTTGILGELHLVNIGIGYTLPFKVVGAPWINAELFAKRLNDQKFPGVWFQPFYYKPMFGRFAKKDCQGVLIAITDHLKFKPMSTQFLIIGMLKSLYPDKFQESMATLNKGKETLCKLSGSAEVPRIITEEKNIIWKLCTLQLKGREDFLAKRQLYLLKEYAAK